MKVIKATQQMLETRTLVLGFQGENLRTQLRIDCSATFAEYPNATPALAIKPPTGETYPVFVDRDGTEVVWDIVANNLILKGDGELQLTFYKDNVIAKTSVGHITVNRSLQIDGDMPDVVATWIENANRKLAEVDAQIVELEGMVDTATDAATRAEQSASTASTKAEQAAGSAATATEKATEATNAAGTATAKAAEAQTAALTATQKATAAADSERIATAKAVEATTAATTATAKAEQATEAAQTATEKAGDASASATAAQASATDAAVSATAASASETAAKASETAASASATQAATSAQNAGIAAQTATQKAAEATQSATNAATFAGTATTKAEEAAASAQAASDAKMAVEQTAEQLADSLEQIDQNTQDIAELDERKANIDGSYPDMTVGNAEQLNSSKYVENSEPYTLRTSGGSSDIGNREYVDAVVGGTLAWNQAVRDEASENSTDFADVVTVTDAVEDAAGVKVKLEPVQDLHGYDHPWPAGGGKNILPYIPNTGANNIGVTVSYDTDNEAYVLNGTTKSSGDICLAIIPKDVLPISNDMETGCRILSVRVLGGSMTLGEGTGITYAFSLFDYSNTRFVRGVVYGSENEVDGYYGRRTNGLPSTGAYNLYVQTWRTGTVFNNLKLRFQIEEAATTDALPTAWTPYSNICPISGWDGVQIVVSPTTDAEDGQTYDITLPSEAGTVYGGELTVNADGSGSLVVDRAKKILNGTEPYGTSSYASNENYAHIILADVNYSKRNQGAIMCDKLPMNGSAPYFNNGVGVWQGGSYVWYICVKKEWLESDNSAGMLSWISSNRPEAVYYFAEPQTFTLTPTEIRTLLGTNNVWSDAGQTALTYTGTDEHLTLESGKKYLARISGTDSMLLGSGQEITAAKGIDNVFDLTRMFGTAVADYVYGQGAAFFRKWFPGARYPYNAGELRSVEGLQSHDMVGFNLWDEEWEKGDLNLTTGEPTASNSSIRSKNFVPVLPNTSYYFKGVSSTGLWTMFYDADKNVISDGLPSGSQAVSNARKLKNDAYTTPINCRYIKFYLEVAYGTTYKHDICISLAHNNSRNGEYEPYEKHSYPLDSTVVLRGIPKVDANGVYWDGDRYLPDGTVERKYGVLVCDGTISYNTPSIVGNYSRVQVNFTNGAGKLIYPQAVASWLDRIVNYSLESNHFYCNDMGAVIIVDTSLIGSTAESVRAFFAAHPLEIVYELDTPTTETAQPYHSTQWVNDWGTEEFVSTGIVPVGTETRYPANLRDKLQHLPDAASGNGSYLITQTDGQMVLTPFPAPPSTAGNYVLKATVVNGVATYTWEVAT